MHTFVYVWIDGDGYGVDPPSTVITTLLGQQAYNIINVCVFVNKIQKHIEMDMEQIQLVNHHYPFKDQQAYSIVNVCVFVTEFRKRCIWK